MGINRLGVAMSDGEIGHLTFPVKKREEKHGWPAVPGAKLRRSMLRVVTQTCHF